jgi:Fe-S-cluster containining protein
VQRIAAWLGLSARRFREAYLRRDEEGEIVLVLKPNGDCVFWEEGCAIYPVRPRQCRTFPFWSETLASRESWEELKSFCHGIDEGRLYPIEEIRAVSRGRATGASPSS